MGNLLTETKPDDFHHFERSEGETSKRIKTKTVEFSAVNEVRANLSKFDAAHGFFLRWEKCDPITTNVSTSFLSASCISNKLKLAHTHKQKWSKSPTGKIQTQLLY